MADRSRDFFKVDIETLRPLRGARTGEWTAAAPKGLSLRASVGRDGEITRAWQSRYTRPSGGAGRLVYGHYPAMSVEAAVAAHKAARELLRAGLDPATERAEEQRRMDGRTTVTAAFARFCEARGGEHDARPLTPKTLGEYRRHFALHIEPAIGGMAVADVDAAAVKKLLRDEWASFDARQRERVAAAAERGVERNISPGDDMVRRLHNLLGSFFNWAVSVDLIDLLPVPPLKAMSYAKKDPDPRPLEPGEVPSFWAGVEAAAMTPRTKAALRLMLLTGARANEILSLQRRDVFFDSKIIDARGDDEREIGVGWIELRKTKNGKPRVVPLTETSRAILAGVLSAAGPEPEARLFPNKADAARPMLVSSLDHAVSRNLDRFKLLDEDRVFTAHCLRATVSTLIQRRGFSEETAGLVLGHSKRTVTGRSYTKYAALPEKYDALRAVERTVLRALGDNVASLAEWRRA